MERVVTTQWRVETDQTLDDFDENEREAREWHKYSATHEDWMPSRLLKRTVVVETGDWEGVE